MKKEGLSIHCHHNILVEYCYDYDERVEAIKKYKPKHEQETRLRLFKLLPQEAIDELPKGLVEAYKARDEACKAWVEADKAWVEAYKAWDEADKARAEAGKAWVEAYEAWDKADREAWHKKWCGCKEWNGKEIVFNPTPKTGGRR